MISFSRMQCELSLNKAETVAARQELLDLFRRIKTQMEQSDPQWNSPIDWTNINMMHVCQYFEWSSVEKWIDDENASVDGALLSRIVALINEKQLFLKNILIDFDNSIFEVIFFF